MEVIKFIAETLLHGICCGIVCAFVHFLIEERQKKKKK